ncbi:hypothetical protein [Deinococcus gobiensis]|uniref:hypothetical protein n=1 Tax=Deinococcus gobiensis TaxID=502394 RepID=UPI0011AE181F|nr:hypothetical protein [Deinococcus gobiensis]
MGHGLPEGGLVEHPVGVIERQVARREGLNVEEGGEDQWRDLLEVHLELLSVQWGWAQDEMEGLHFDPEQACGGTQDARLLARPDEAAGKEQGGGGEGVGLGKAPQRLRTAQGQAQERAEEVMCMGRELPPELSHLAG